MLSIFSDEILACGYPNVHADCEVFNLGQSDWQVVPPYKYAEELNI